MVEKMMAAINKGASGKGDKTTRNLVVGMILLVVVAGAGAALASNHAVKSASKPSAVEASDGDGIGFNPNAPVKVDFYEDFQCPHCRDFEAVNNGYITKVITDGKIHAVFHPMSFIGNESVVMAAASACASDQGKFLQMRAALFANQAANENSGIWSNAKLIVLGHSLGIASTKYDECINNGQYLNWTKNVEDYAGKANINSTPTVLINGKPIAQNTYLNATAFQAAFAAAGVK
jgi:protein-disulfide isomerase